MSNVTATPAATFTWRKTQSGEWVICGDAKALRHAVRGGLSVPVTSKSGASKRVFPTRVGKTFSNGLAYGYLGDDYDERPSYRATYGGGSARRSSCITGGNCSSFGTGRSCGAHDCDGY